MSQDDEHMANRVRSALKTTKNKSAAGPDGISWRLLKMLGLGKLILRDVARVADTRKQLRMPSEWRDMMMVIIPRQRSYGSERVASDSAGEHGRQVLRKDSGAEPRRTTAAMAPPELCGERGESSD